VIRADVEALASMRRDSAGAGERAAAAWIAERLRAEGVDDVRVEPFRGQPHFGPVQAAHGVAGLAAARMGGVLGAALAAAAAAGLELDGSGRSQPLRRWLPAGEGANVVARIRGDGPTLVVLAHHDAARYGLSWHPLKTESGAARRLRTRRIDPYLLPEAAALGAIAAGSLLPGRSGRWLRVAGAVVTGLAVALQLEAARGPVVPGASDNATGVAALLALAADPPPGLDLWLVSCGCEESGMEGMRAFLAAHGGELDLDRTLVLGVDTLGAGTPIVLSGEGPVLEHRYAEQDLALVDRAAAKAGLEAPQRWRIGGWTDAVLARLAGLRTVSLLSVGPKGVFTNYHRQSDTPDHVDWESVERCVQLARGVAAAWAGTPR
jgi:Peptidase family M28